MLKRIFGFLAAGFLLSAAPVWAAVYEIDAAHSSVNFKIKHLLSNTRGSFGEYEGTFDYEPEKPESWKAEAAVKTASIDTKVADRDKHLRGPDFFDVEKYPVMTFKSTKVEAVTENTSKLEGILSLHGVEKTIVLDLEVLGIVKDPWGNIRSAFTASGKINRKDFGMEYNKVLDAGGFLLGEEVEISIEIEAIEKK